MASIHYDGLDGWRKSAGFWGILGTAIAVGVGLPLPWAAGGVLAGAVFGAVLAYLLWKMNLRALVRVDWILPFALAVPLYFVVDAGHGPRTSTIGFLALGSLFHAAKQLAFGLLGTRAMKGVNDKNVCWLSKLDPPVKRTGPPPTRPGGELLSSVTATCDDALDGASKSVQHAGHPPMNPPGSSSEIDAAIQGMLANLPEPYATEARSFVLPVTSTKPFRSLQTIAPDVTCLSGPALLAAGESWPTRNGQALAFLARINFADLPATPFRHPGHGAVEIFFDIENSPWGHDPADLTGHMILFHPNPSGLDPALAPSSGRHPPLRRPLAFSQSVEFTPSRDFEDRYQDLLETLDDATGEVVDDFYQTLSELCGGDGHRVLSLPLLIQDDMDGELALAARVRGLPEDTPWTLLLQLDSDPTLNWSWGDSGYLFFWVPTEDLAAGRFDRSWVVLQCT